jgi:hypothetical protein
MLNAKGSMLDGVYDANSASRKLAISNPQSAISAVSIQHSAVSIQHLL